MFVPPAPFIVTWISAVEFPVVTVVDIIITLLRWIRHPVGGAGISGNVPVEMT
jgi:hypothetical protein